VEAGERQIISAIFGVLCASLMIAASKSVSSRGGIAESYAKDILRFVTLF